MSKDTTTPCGAGRPSEDETEQPRPDANTSFDMPEGMARMMASCGCGPHAMPNAAGCTSRRASPKPVAPTPEPRD